MRRGRGEAIGRGRAGAAGRGPRPRPGGCAAPGGRPRGRPRCRRGRKVGQAEASMLASTRAVHAVSVCLCWCEMYAASSAAAAPVQFSCIFSCSWTLIPLRDVLWPARRWSPHPSQCPAQSCRALPSMLVAAWPWACAAYGCARRVHVWCPHGGRPRRLPRTVGTTHCSSLYVHTRCTLLSGV